MGGWVGGWVGGWAGGHAGGHAGGLAALVWALVLPLSLSKLTGWVPTWPVHTVGEWVAPGGARWEGTPAWNLSSALAHTSGLLIAFWCRASTCWLPQGGLELWEPAVCMRGAQRHYNHLSALC